MIRIYSNGRKRYSILLIVIVFVGIFSCENTNKVTIYRDTWGIPHIYANSEANLAYAFGYAQAQDRLIQILKSYRYAEGTLSEAYGDKYIDMDYIQRVWQHAKISKDKFGELSPEIQKIATYFIAGIKQYMRDFPEQVPDWAPEIYPWHVVAWGRTFIWGWPLGQARGDLYRGKRKMAEPNTMILRNFRLTANPPPPAAPCPNPTLIPSRSPASRSRSMKSSQTPPVLPTRFCSCSR